MNKESIKLDQGMTYLSLFFLNKILLRYKKSLNNFSGLSKIPIDFSPTKFYKIPNFEEYHSSFDLNALK